MTALDVPVEPKAILLLSKDVETRILIRDALLNWGYLLLQAVDGQQAAYVCRLMQGQIHLTILDAKSLQVDRWPDLQLPNTRILVLLDSLVTGELPTGMEYLTSPLTAEGIARKVEAMLDAKN